MRSSAMIALLAQAAVPSLAFLATPIRSRGGINLPVDAFAASAAVAPTPFKQLEPDQETPFFSRSSTALLVGACVVAICSSRRSAKDRASTTRYVWTQHAAPVEMNEEGEGPLGGPAYRMSIGLNRQAKNAMGRKMRYLGQQKKLKESGIWWSTYGAWTKWDKNRDMFNMYKGPESHPDNPWFPAASGGYRAMTGWAPANLNSNTSAKTSGTSGAFVGGSAPRIISAKRAVESSRAGRSALVMHAHKKAASSTKNHGSGPPNPKFWGVAKSGLQGSAVKNGQLLVKQKGMNWYNGANVTRCSDYSLRSTKDGIVQWRGSYKHKEVYVVPWEYVRLNCVWKNCNTLAPKVYEPWMGDKFNYGKRHMLFGMYQEWKQSDAGQEHAAKKVEKVDIQKVIMKKIRAYKKQKQREGVTQTREPREKVAANDSDSEKEA